MAYAPLTINSAAVIAAIDTANKTYGLNDNSIVTDVISEDAEIHRIIDWVRHGNSPIGQPIDQSAMLILTIVAAIMRRFPDAPIAKVTKIAHGETAVALYTTGIVAGWLAANLARDREMAAVLGMEEKAND